VYCTFSKAVSQAGFGLYHPPISSGAKPQRGVLTIAQGKRGTNAALGTTPPAIIIPSPPLAERGQEEGANLLRRAKCVRHAAERRTRHCLQPVC